MGRARRLAVLWATLAVLAVLAGALTALAERGDAPPRPRAVAQAIATPVPQATATVTAAPTPRKPRMPRGHDVRAVLRRALLRDQIGRGDWRAWHAVLLRARSASRRLPGARGVELRSVLGGVEALAAAGRLTTSRMPLAFLTLERNTTVWRFKPFPHSGQRMTFGRDRAVFQYFPSHGVQFHALATAGRANALALPCTSAAAGALHSAGRAAARAAVRRRLSRATPTPAPARPASGARCHPRTLTRRLDRLVALSSSRGGFAAWEYGFSYAGSAPYWISAMTQATAAQALSRGAEALGRPDYRAVALSALGAFDAPPPVGVRSGGQYVMYSFNPTLRILNGFLQSVIGLHDVAELTGSSRAARLYRAGERSARRAVAAYDTGAWSRYSLGGRESTLPYHQLVTGFLQGLCARTAREAYCGTAARFTRYEHEPPTIHLAVTRKPREDRPAAVSVWVSKVSDVAVGVRGRRGPVLRVVTRLPRGRYRYAWTPPRGGAYRVVVSAVGPEGRRAVARAEVEAKAKPKPKPKRKKERPKGKKKDVRLDGGGRSSR